MTIKYKKVLSPIILLAISLVMLTTSSFAWFSLNRQVTTTNMQIKVKAPTDLKIAYPEGDPDKLGNIVELTKEDIAFSLAPTSSYNGLDFFVAPYGSADTPYMEYKDHLLQRQFGYKANVVGYIDFVFTVYNRVTLTYTLEALADFKHTTTNSQKGDDLEKAMRLAIFLDEPKAENLIYLGKGEGGGKAVASINGDKKELITPTKTTFDIKGRSLDENASDLDKKAGHQKIVVRIWIEGEEKATTRENFKDLDGFFSFSITIQIAGGYDDQSDDENDQLDEGYSSENSSIDSSSNESPSIAESSVKS